MDGMADGDGVGGIIDARGRYSSGGSCGTEAGNPRFWVDAFHDGFKTREQVDQLMRDVRRSKANTVIVQCVAGGCLFQQGSGTPHGRSHSERRL